MGLSEVEAPSQPSAARQSQFRWSYGEHGRLEDSGAGLASSFAAVVVPLFWKSNLDNVRFSSSERRPSNAGLFQRKSVTTEDVAVLRTFENDGTTTYNSANKRYVCHREVGIGMLTAVRSEGDLRCKYSAALSSARCFDPEFDACRSEGQVNREFVTVNASFCGDGGLRPILRRSDWPRIARRGPHSSAHCTKERGPFQVLKDAERLKVSGRTRSYDTNVAIQKGSNSQDARTFITQKTTASPSMQRSAHARHLEELRRGEPTGEVVVQKGLHQQRFYSQIEPLSNGTCFSASGSKTYRSLTVRPDRKTADFPGMKLNEGSQRTELEKAHRRMKDHMADMMRFLDRMQGKHVRRRTTAAFRLRAAKLSDRPKTISYAALRCLTGVAEGLMTGRENARELFPIHAVSIEETPPAAPLQPAAAAREEEVTKRKMRRYAVAVGTEEERIKQKKYSCVTKKVKKQPAREREDVGFIAETAAPAEKAVFEVELQGEGAARAREGSSPGRKKSLFAGASVNAASCEKIPLYVLPAAERRNNKGSAGADDAGTPTVTDTTLRQDDDSTLRLKGLSPEVECTVAGKRTVGAPSTGESAEVLAKQRCVRANRRGEERRCVNISNCGTCCTCKATTSTVVGCPDRQQTLAAPDVGEEGICTECSLALRISGVEMGRGEHDYNSIASVNLAEVVTGKSEGSAEEHSDTGAPVHERGQQVYRGSTRDRAEHNPRTAEATQHGVSSGEAALSPATGAMVDNKQVRPISDAAISWKVASANPERCSFVRLSGERGDQRQRPHPAQAGALSTGVVQTREEIACTHTKMRSAFRTPVPQREKVHAKCQFSPGEEVFVTTADGEVHCKGRLGYMLGYNGVLSNLDSALQLHKTGTMQQEKVGVEHVVLGGTEARGNVIDYERTKQKPPEKTTPPTSGKIAEEAFQLKQGGLVQNIVKGNALNEGNGQRIGDGTQARGTHLQSAALNSRAEQVYQGCAQNLNKGNDVRASKVAAKAVKGTASDLARMHGRTGDDLSSAHAAKKSHYAAGALIEVFEPRQDVSVYKSLLVAPEKSGEPVAIPLKLLVGESIDQKKRTCLEKESISGVTQSAQENVLESKFLRGALGKAEYHYASLAVGSSDDLSGILCEDTGVFDFSSLAASDSGKSPGSNETECRNFHEKSTTCHVKTQCTVEEGKGSLHSRCLSFEQPNGKRGIDQNDFRFETIGEGGKLERPAGTASPDQRDMLPLEARRTSDEDDLFRSSPVPADEAQKVENATGSRKCQVTGETPFIRVDSRASTIPSSYGTVCLSSQEDLLGEDGASVLPLRQIETDTSSRYSAATKQQPEAQLAPRATSENDSILPGAIGTHHVLEARATASAKGSTHTATTTVFAGAKQTSAPGEKTRLSHERVDHSVAAESDGSSLVEGLRHLVLPWCAPAHTSTFEPDISHQKGSSNSSGEATTDGGAGEVKGKICSHTVAEHSTTSDEGRTVNHNMPPAGSACGLSGVGSKKQQCLYNFATSVPPFLRHRGFGGAYTNQELLVLSGGFWYGNSGTVTLKMGRVPPRRQDHAFLASQAAGRRARAIQQHLLLSTEREMRLSRRRLRSMFYWPKSFIHACAFAVHTKATMMAAGSLVRPSRQNSYEPERFCSSVPSTLTSGALTRSHEQLNSAKSPQSACCGNTEVRHLPGSLNREDCHSHTASCLSLENLALMDYSCNLHQEIRDYLGNREKRLELVALNVVRGAQNSVSSASRAQLGKVQQEVLISQNLHPVGDMQHASVEKMGTEMHECIVPLSPYRQPTQQSIDNGATLHSPPLSPASTIASRPPLIARWSLSDAEIVEVAGTFSSPPWKVLYRTQRDRELGGFTLDLYSVAPPNMLLLQERFCGLRVDDRHKHVVHRGWWICPLHPNAKEEAVLQVALKFRVDGVWRCDPVLPIHRDEQGRSVNVLVVYQGQHVASCQKGHTQYFFEGLDLSPLTYNPSRSPAYQTDGPVLVQPSSEDMKFEDSIMSNCRRSWNPPSCRPLMSSHCGGLKKAPMLLGMGDASESDTKKDENTETYGPAQSLKRARDEKQKAKEAAKRDAGDLQGRVRKRSDTATGSSKPSQQSSQITVEKSWQTQWAKHAESGQQRQRLIADVGVKASEEPLHTDAAGQHGGAGDSKVIHHLVASAQPQSEMLMLPEDDNRQAPCCISEHRRSQFDNSETRTQQRERTQRSCLKATEPVGAEAMKSSWNEKSRKGQIKETPQEGDLHVSKKSTPSAGKVDTRVYHPLGDGQGAIFSKVPVMGASAESFQKAYNVALARSSKRVVGSETPDEGATGATLASLFSHELMLWKRTREEEGERQTPQCIGGSDEMPGDGMGRVREEEQVAARSAVLEESEAAPIKKLGVAEAIAAPGTGVVVRAPQRPASGSVARCGGAGKVDVGAGAAEMKTSINTFNEGKPSSTFFAPRLNRGFSAYGSTPGVAKSEQSAPTGEVCYPVRNPATGALRRVSTLGDGYWPTRVTKYLQTPDIFSDFSGLDLARWSTPAEGARLKRGLTLQCGSYMIPHPDKTESGGADAFFVATPVPPSSRYSKRFACMDVPLARSSTPPLRSIPPSRQRGKYMMQATENGESDNRSSGTTSDIPPSEPEEGDDLPATTRPSVIASLASFASGFNFPPTRPLSSDTSTNACKPLLYLPAGSTPERSRKKSAEVIDSASEFPAAGEGQPQQPSARITRSTSMSAESGIVKASAPNARGTNNAGLLRTAASVASSSSRQANISVAKATPSLIFSCGATDSACNFEIGNQLPEDEASAVRMLLREALAENGSSGLAKLLSACPPSPYGRNRAATGQDGKSGLLPGHNFVCGRFICAGAAMCTPPHRPPGAPLMIAGGYSSVAKGVVIGSGGELGGAVCVGVADGVGEWDSFGLNPRLFAEELMRGCWKAAHEKWFWEVAAVEKRALEVLKRGYKAARSFGSSTALVACLDTRSEKLGIANLGDSGVIVLRRQHQPRLVYRKMTCVHRSKEQQHNFNCPYQLSRLPSPSQYHQLVSDGKHSLVRVLRSATMLSQDTPEMADVYTVNTLEGDLILLGTDGVFDNLFDHEICALATAALSPYEAALLNKENLATSADAVAAAVAEAAAHRSRDPLAKTPFMRHARRAQTHFVGGKMDDITVVACWVTRGQLPPDYLFDGTASL